MITLEKLLTELKADSLNEIVGGCHDTCGCVCDDTSSTKKAKKSKKAKKTKKSKGGNDC